MNMVVRHSAMALEIDPRNLRLVCNDWRASLDELAPRDKEGKIDKKIAYENLHPIWQRIYKTS